jgi:hypothetical protein
MMRGRSWRRALVALAVLIGFGVGASSVPASAAPVHTHVITNGGDWWW